MYLYKNETQIDMNDLTLQEAKACYAPEAIKKSRAQLYSLRKQFITEFSPDFIQRMSIEDYIEGKGNTNSFCYWVERKLDRLGSIRGSFATIFGIYYSVDNRDYRFAKKFGDNYKRAFETIKTQILDLLNAGRNNDIQNIISNKLATMFKGKILSLYYPDKYLNIFSKEHLIHYLKVFNLDTEQLIKKDPVYLREALLHFKNEDKDMRSWSNDIFSNFLYTYFAPNDNNNKEGDLDFPTIEDFEYVDNLRLANTPDEKDPTHQTTSGNRKINYEKESRKFRKLGERGEHIVMIAERQRLKELGYTDERIDNALVQMSKSDDSCGYDILSVNNDESKRYIEVKATTGKVGDMSFYYTINELNTAKEKGRNYYIYIVYDIRSTKPKIWRIRNPFINANKMDISPIQFKVSLHTQSHS